jgi:hypothetical protein
MAVRLLWLVLIAVLALGAGGCAANPHPSGSVGRVSTASPSSATSGTDPTASTPSPSPSPILPDGRSPVYLTKIDVGRHTITFDLIEFLTGDAAKKAWKKANPGSGEDGPPNDYFIVNDNPKLRTLPVANPVVFKVVDPQNTNGTTNKTITFEGATAYFVSIKPDQSDHRLSWDPFWITVVHGVVNKIEEQFLP